MIAETTGRYRQVDEGMWCWRCGSVVQGHVDPGRDRDRLEKAVRRRYPQYDGNSTLCVCVAGGGVYLIVWEPMNTSGVVSLGIGWDSLFYDLNPQA